MDDFQRCSICKKDIAARNFVIHSAQCERNVRVCELCSEPVLRTDFADHMESHSASGDAKSIKEEKNKLQANAVTLTCGLCDLEFTEDAFHEHNRGCKARTEEMSPGKLLSCKFCQLDLSLKQYDEHVLACGARTERCCICDEYVMYKDMQRHDMICQKRAPVSRAFICKYCKEEFPYEILQEHDRECGSKTDKCFQCNCYILRKDLDKHPQFCKKNLSLQSGVCPMCNETVPWMEMEMHKLMCQYLTCPFEDNDPQDTSTKNSGIAKIQNKFEKFDLNSEERFKCPHCHERMPMRMKTEHQISCKKTWKNTSDDEAVIGAAAAISGARPKQFAFESVYSDCPYCSKKIPDMQFVKHLETCSANLKTCRFCNKDIARELFDAHLEQCFPSSKNMKEKKKETDKHKGGFLSSIFPNRNKSPPKKDDYLPPSPYFLPEEPVMIPCEFCDISFPANIIIEHQSGCNPQLLHFPTTNRYDEKRVLKEDSNKQQAPKPDPPYMASNFVQHSGANRFDGGFTTHAPVGRGRSTYRERNVQNERPSRLEFENLNRSPPESRPNFDSVYRNKTQYSYSEREKINERRKSSLESDEDSLYQSRKQNLKETRYLEEKNMNKIEATIKQVKNVFEKGPPPEPLFKFGKNKFSQSPSHSDEECPEEIYLSDEEDKPRKMPSKHTKKEHGAALKNMLNSNLNPNIHHSDNKYDSSDSTEFHSFSDEDDVASPDVTSNNVAASRRSPDVTSNIVTTSRRSPDVTSSNVITSRYSSDVTSNNVAPSRRSFDSNSNDVAISRRSTDFTYNDDVATSLRSPDVTSNNVATSRRSSDVTYNDVATSRRSPDVISNDGYDADLDPYLDFLKKEDGVLDLRVKNGDCKRTTVAEQLSKAFAKSPSMNETPNNEAYKTKSDKFPDDTDVSKSFGKDKKHIQENIAMTEAWRKKRNYRKYSSDDSDN